MAKVYNKYDNVDYFSIIEDTRIKHKDFFHMKNLYVVAHEWCIEEGWGPRKDWIFPETFYMHRFTQEAGDELWIWWRLEKIPQDNTFYKYVLDVDWHIILLQSTEVMFNGMKFKANTGEPEFKIYAKLVYDYDGVWKNHWFLKHFYTLFAKRIFLKDLYAHKRQFHHELYRFKEAMKVYMKLKTYLPEPEGQKFYYNKEFN
ncbi:MAG: hypothetical protein QF632_01320 [Candidatus Woesearchaeota archaeon]|jgi:hypothetical protein|nr:hypothetical protein [Candidatus Woesearchaeota archaeon]MDP7458027.1 hypothetical protein [Candidatus Woesearchaeota archaeon]